MNQNLEKELYRTAALTFEELGFMLPTTELEEQQRAAPLEATVRVPFHGPCRGELMVRIYGNLLTTIVANILGDDTPMEKSMQRDAIGEIGNVICGNVLPALCGSTAVFKLGVPQTLEHAVRENLAKIKPSNDWSLEELPKVKLSDDSLVAKAELGLDQGRAELFLFLYDDSKAGLPLGPLGQGKEE